MSRLGAILSVMALLAVGPEGPEPGRAQRAGSPQSPPPAQAPRDVRSPAAAAHSSLLDIEDAACPKCHKGLATRKVVHGPVAVGQCLVCHPATRKDGQVVVERGDGAAPRCVGCHDEVGALMKQPSVHAPVESGPCTTCHDPHGSNARMLLPADANGSCLSCHDDVRAELGEKFPHQPAVQACLGCHDPHAARFRSQLRQQLNALCLTCHTAAPELTAANLEAPASATAVHPSLAGLAGKGRQIHLDAALRSGHPMANHPVASPKDPLEASRPFTCVSCHRPHGAPTQQLLRYGARTGMELCLKCHKY